MEKINELINLIKTLNYDDMIQHKNSLFDAIINTSNAASSTFLHVHFDRISAIIHLYDIIKKTEDDLKNVKTKF